MIPYIKNRIQWFLKILMFYCTYIFLESLKLIVFDVSRTFCFDKSDWSNVVMGLPDSLTQFYLQRENQCFYRVLGIRSQLCRCLCWFTLLEVWCCRAKSNTGTCANWHTPLPVLLQQQTGHITKTEFVHFRLQLGP